MFENLRAPADNRFGMSDGAEVGSVKRSLSDWRLPNLGSRWFGAGAKAFAPKIRHDFGYQIGDWDTQTFLIFLPRLPSMSGTTRRKSSRKTSFLDLLAHVSVMQSVCAEDKD